MNRTSTLIFIFLFLCALALPACADRKAEELYKTAQFEELQTNWAHAGQLYERILADYPKSNQAEKAKDRLSALADEGKYPVAASP
jgi:outer membrane protein assembly factor BamD (BamD/ComL family)